MADSLDMSVIAAQYGFSLAIMNGNPELKSIFDKAVAETWSGDRIQAAVRNTQWYQQTSENRRNVLALKSADPASYQEKLGRVTTQVQMLAAEMGAALPDVRATAEHFLINAYDDNQIRQALVDYINFTDGRMLGQAGQWEQQLRQYASDMGVTISDGTIGHYVRQASLGTETISDQESKIRAMAASAYPNLAERLGAGETVATIADPYKQTMATLLEMNPESLTLQDPMIRQALSAPGKDGQPALQTLYDFENTVRKDSRWLGTKNAQDSAMAVTNNILKQWGVVS